jgi:ketosteroid isomerase-like protein
MKLHRFAAVALAGATAFLSLSLVCRASDSSDAMATVKAVAAAFNRGDLKGFAALCDSPAYVIDDFPPHQWDGPDACANWADALSAEMKRDQIAGAKVAFGTPWQVAVNGGVAYVVVPATLSYRQKGKPVKDSASVFTVVLRKTVSGWRITSWSWAQH